MNVSEKILLPLGVVALMGACAPYPPEPYPPRPPVNPTDQPALTDEEQRQLDESRRRLKEQEEQASRDNDTRSDDGPTSIKPDKPKYPTASPVPGKDGFVFNPYTHNIVNVKGIASGKLCRDPDDTNVAHKFRVP